MLLSVRTHGWPCRAQAGECLAPQDPALVRALWAEAPLLLSLTWASPCQCLPLKTLVPKFLLPQSKPLGVIARGNRFVQTRFAVLLPLPKRTLRGHGQQFDFITS